MSGCRTTAHRISRRRLLGAFAGGIVGGRMMGLGGLLQPVVAEQVRRKKRQVLLVWIDGGMSQFESWNPKPKTEHGGPFRAIPTSVDGVHFSELLEHTARQAHHLTVIRSMETKDENHSSAVPRIQRGDPPNRGVPYPFLGSAIAHFLPNAEGPLPPYVHIKPGRGGFMTKDAGFLGPRHGCLYLGDGKLPKNGERPEGLTEEVEAARRDLRERANRRFARGRVKGPIDAHTQTYDMAAQLMAHADLFDAAKAPSGDQERYGSHQLGRHLLQARRLLEAGVTFVKVTSYHWDTHADNFNMHGQLMPQFDKPFAALVEDLHERGMLEHTLVICMSEFGRTPKINNKLGRDHWPESWSVALAGCGLKSGMVVGGTDELGLDITSEKYDVGHLYYTLFTALGLDPTSAYEHKGQTLPAIDVNCHALIKGALA